MPYSRNTWVNNTTPAISAVNLNRLTDELEQQAFARSVSHTLPTWADGVVPAVSDPVPLNEMERVLAAVATSLGLSYTVTTWSAGWVPARNAANLNKMEVQAVANRNVIDTPSGYANSPVGFLSNRAQFFPPTNVGKYGVVVATGPPPAGFVGVNLRYLSTVTCVDGANNISSATVLANGWEMRDSGGVLLTNAIYGGALADPGNAGYQEAWCQMMLSKVTAAGGHGFWGDDFTPSVWAVTDGRRPAAYPTDSLYEDALLSFATYVRTFCNQNNMKSGYNASHVSDSNASKTTAWFSRLGAQAHYMTVEYWMTPGSPAPAGTVRITPTTQWYHWWPEWRNVHVAANNAGSGFLPLSVGPTGTGRVYSLATFLLDWNGLGANMWSVDNSYVNQTDPWVSQYGIAAQLGAPLGNATQSGYVWTRQFAGGTVSVNSNLGTASIN